MTATCNPNTLTPQTINPCTANPGAPALVADMPRTASRAMVRLRSALTPALRLVARGLRALSVRHRSLSEQAMSELRSTDRPPHR